jgi:hypothetical protein
MGSLGVNRMSMIRTGLGSPTAVRFNASLDAII